MAKAHVHASNSLFSKPSIMFMTVLFSLYTSFSRLPIHKPSSRRPRVIKPHSLHQKYMRHSTAHTNPNPNPKQLNQQPDPRNAPHPHPHLHSTDQTPSTPLVKYIICHDYHTSQTPLYQIVQVVSTYLPVDLYNDPRGEGRLWRVSWWVVDVVLGAGVLGGWDWGGGWF